MHETFTIKEKVNQIFFLLIPILVTQLGMFSMVFFNTTMAGNYHSSDLAGVAIGASIWNPIYLGISGILLAVSPIAAQRFGERKNKEVSTVVTHGVYLSCMIGLFVVIAGVLFLNPILDFMKLEPSVRDTAFHYLIGISFGILPLFIFNVLRSFIYALGNTRIVMYILLLALPINLFFNYCLIFGKWGFPELGGAGGGFATTITYWCILGMTVFVIKKIEVFSTFFSFRDFKKFELSKCVEILKIGIPMGLSAFFETSMFALVTILISRFSISTIAAFQSAMNIVTFLYMIPTSVSIALTNLVGFEVGARRYKDARIYSWLGISLSVLISLVAGLLVVVLRYDVAGLYSNEIVVINLTAHFLIYALFFHISDAIQVTAQAALRGYKDVNIAFVIVLISYWFICLPVGYILAHYGGFGAEGYWLGLTAGLFSAGFALSGRLIHIQKRKFFDPAASKIS